MKTNFIFQRQETVDGVTKTITRIVPVDLPSIDPGMGWIYKGHTDVIEVENLDCCSILSKSSNCEPKKTARKSVDPEAKFESPVKGSAKLVKAKGVIKIAARRGKSTYNITAPNSVCISDQIKNEFFRDCNNIFGNAHVYQFTKADGEVYAYWDRALENEYKRQRILVKGK